MTSKTRLAQTAGFLHHGQSRRRAAAVNMPGSRTRRPGLTAASTGTPSKAEEPRYQPQDQRPVYTDTLTSSGNSGRKFATIDRYVNERLAIFASTKHGLRGRNWASRFSYTWYQGLGVYQLSGTVRYRTAHA
jgi:hypothetical protein